MRDACVVCPVFVNVDVPTDPLAYFTWLVVQAEVFFIEVLTK
jgi:hypothetical protein